MLPRPSHQQLCLQWACIYVCVCTHFQFHFFPFVPGNQIFLGLVSAHWQLSGLQVVLPLHKREMLAMLCYTPQLTIYKRHITHIKKCKSSRMLHLYPNEVYSFYLNFKGLLRMDGAIRSAELFVFLIRTIIWLNIFVRVARKQTVSHSRATRLQLYICCYLYFIF